MAPFIKHQGESIKNLGVDLEFFLVKGKGIKGYLNSVIDLRRFLDKKKFDVIHAHYGLTGLMCGLSFKKIPIVLSIMGSDAYGIFNQEGKRKLSSIPIMFLTQIALMFSKHIIVKSDDLKKYIPYKMKLTVIPNGVDFNKFKPEKREIENTQILFLGNPKDPRKNYQLAKKVCNNLSFCILKNPYPIKQKKFAVQLNESSIFLLTSYNEGSPNVIKEAMACNRPIVATDVGDIKWLFGNEPGHYITSFEPDDIKSSVIKAIEFEKKFKKTNGRERLIKLGLDSETVALRIIAVYKNLANKKL